jgi:hypothetical protein
MFDISGLTGAGRALLGKVELGATLVVTEIGIGDGTFTGTDVSTVTALDHEVVRFPADRMRKSDDGDAVFGGKFQGQMISEDIEFSEMGLYADDPDDGEILFSYLYSHDPDKLPAGGADEKILDIVIAIGITDAQISLTSASYALASDVETAQETADGAQTSIQAHVSDFANPHNVLSDQINMTASDTTKLWSFLGGSLSALTTSVKTSIIAAINSLAIAGSNLASIVNSLSSRVSEIEDKYFFCVQGIVTIQAGSTTGTVLIPGVGNPSSAGVDNRKDIVLGIYPIGSGSTGDTSQAQFSLTAGSQYGFLLTCRYRGSTSSAVSIAYRAAFATGRVVLTTTGNLIANNSF